MKVLIIGGGIAGYTTALACQKFGIDYELFESQANIAQHGAGIWLSPNGLSVINAISSDLVGALQKERCTTKDFGLIHKSKKPISLMDMEEIEVLFGFRNLMVHRNTLQEVMQNYISSPIHFNKKVRSVEEGMEGVEVVFEDGTCYKGTVLLACDGVGSTVRKVSFPPVTLRNSGQHCWRAIVDYLPKPGYKDKFFEQIGGPSIRAAYAPVNNHQVYVYITAKVKQVDTKDIKNQLMELVGDFPFDVGGVIKASHESNWIIKPLSDFKPMVSWFKGRLALVGDAAHAMTPNMGQGGNQAIESGYVIAKCLASEKTYVEAFQKYQNMRKPYVDKIINESWSLGKLVGLKPVMLRNIFFTLLSKMPQRMKMKNLKKIYVPNYL